MTRLSYRKTSRLFGYSYLKFTKTATSFYLIQRTTISFLLSILYSILFGLNQIQPQGPYDRGLDVFKYINKTIDLICLYQFSLYCVFGVNIVLSRYLTFSRIADFDTWQIALKFNLHYEKNRDADPCDKIFRCFAVNLVEYFNVCPIVLTYYSMHTMISYSFTSCFYLLRISLNELCICNFLCYYIDLLKE